MYANERIIRSGKWDGHASHVGQDLGGKTLLIVGMGGVGTVLAKQAMGLGMKVCYHNRRPKSPGVLSTFRPGTDLKVRTCVVGSDCRSSRIH